MSISHILTRDENIYTSQQITNLASVKYVSKGIEIRSNFYASAAFVPPVPFPNPLPTIYTSFTGITSGNVANGRFVQVVYTKVNNIVTIKFEAFSSEQTDADAGTPHSQLHSTGTPARYQLTLNAVDDRLRNQIINDISTTNPRTGVKVPLELDLTGIGIATGNVIVKLRITGAGVLEFIRVDGANFADPSTVTLGGVSFVSGNSDIVY